MTGFDAQDKAHELFKTGHDFEQLGAYDQALDCYDIAKQLDPTNGHVRFNRSLLLLLLGRFQEAWPDYEYRWNDPQEVQNFPDAWGEHWTGQSLQGKYILVWSGEGRGDCIQMFRYLPMLEALGAHVTVHGFPEVMSLLLVEYQMEPDQYDYHIPFMSLPYRFGTTLASVPPTPRLSVVPEATRDRRFTVGLAWQGSRTHINDDFRSIPASMLRALLWSNINYVSLQHEHQHEDKTALDYAVAMPEPKDFVELAKLILQCDLVITVDTAVAHLAGTLRVPTWIMVTKHPDWRWLLGRDDSPWYPSVRLYRQSAPGDWQGVIDHVRGDLLQLIAKKARPVGCPRCGGSHPPDGMCLR